MTLQHFFFYYHESFNKYRQESIVRLSEQLNNFFHSLCGKYWTNISEMALQLMAVVYHGFNKYGFIYLATLYGFIFNRMW